MNADGIAEADLTRDGQPDLLAMCVRKHFTVCAYDGRDLHLLWAAEAPAEFGHARAFDYADGKLALASDHGVAVFDADGGAARFVRFIEFESMLPTLVALDVQRDEVLVSLSLDARMYVADLKSGTVTTRGPSAFVEASCDARPRLGCQSFDRSITTTHVDPAFTLVYEKPTLSVRRTSDPGKRLSNIPVSDGAQWGIADGLVVTWTRGGERASQLRLFDPSTGASRWEKQWTGIESFGFVAIYRHRLLVLMPGGVHVLEAATGREEACLGYCKHMDVPL